MVFNRDLRSIYWWPFFWVKIKYANVFGKGAHHEGTFNCPLQYVPLPKKLRSKIDPDPWNSFESWLLWGRSGSVSTTSLSTSWDFVLSENKPRQPSFGLNLWLYYWKILLFAANGSTKERWYISGQVIWAKNISNPVTPHSPQLPSTYPSSTGCYFAFVSCPNSLPLKKTKKQKAKLGLLLLALKTTPPIFQRVLVSLSSNVTSQSRNFLFWACDVEWGTLKLQFWAVGCILNVDEMKMTSSTMGVGRMGRIRNKEAECCACNR